MYPMIHEENQGDGDSEVTPPHMRAYWIQILNSFPQSVQGSWHSEATHTLISLQAPRPKDHQFWYFPSALTQDWPLVH